MTILILDLPWPPSINHYWRHAKGRHYISMEGELYRELVYYECIKYRKTFTEIERISILIDAYPPDRRKRDLDNILKSLLDSLQYAEVFKDDSQVDVLTIARKTPLKGRVLITLETL